MSTAREQAREAAPCKCSQAAADAASDVWEPLLRDLLEHFDLAMRAGHLDWSMERLSAARKRVRKALGE